MKTTKKATRPKHDKWEICENCGTRTAQLTNLCGQWLNFRNGLRVQMRVDFMAPQCQKCHDLSLSSEELKQLSSALQASLQRMVHEVLKRIDEHHLRRSDVERALEVNVGYLSRYESGGRIPSPRVMAMLTALAKSPKTTLETLALGAEVLSEEAQASVSKMRSLIPA